MPSRAKRAIEWIENYCLVPHGINYGARVQLSAEDKMILFRIYAPEGPRPIPVNGKLAAYLALLHLCGPEAKQKAFYPRLQVDTFSIWRATTPSLREVLTRNGDRIVCRELGTSFPAAA
jgi:hypothetical protein